LQPSEQALGTTEAKGINEGDFLLFKTSPVNRNDHLVKGFAEAQDALGEPGIDYHRTVIPLDLSR
jgi:hypothetical protein